MAVHPDRRVAGFLLDKTQRRNRYRSGDIVTSVLDWRDTEVRVFGDCAIVVGIHDKAASHRGKPTTVSSGPPTSVGAKATRGG